MTSARLDKSCNRACWGAATAVGVVFLLVAWGLFGLGFLKALIWGIVITIVVWLVLSNWLCGRVRGGSTVSSRPRTAPATPATPPAAPVAAAPAPAAAAPAAEPAPAQAKPATLAAPEGGVADDLKKIKGIGPKLEQLCNSLGVYHFAQIAGWSAAEVAWMDDNLEGFRGRVTRDDWVAQAKLLSEGRETEFSKRVGKGEVY